MELSVRKKSLSDSELSDEWSIVEPLLDGRQNEQIEAQCDLPRPRKALLSDNTGSESDADSVEVLDADPETRLIQFEPLEVDQSLVLDTHPKIGFMWLLVQCYHEYFDPARAKCFFINWVKLIAMVTGFIALIVYLGFNFFSFQERFLYLKNPLDEPILFDSDLNLKLETPPIPVTPDEKHEEVEPIDIEVITAGRDQMSSYQPTRSKKANTVPNSKTSEGDQHEELKDLNHLITFLASTTNKPKLLTSLINIHGELKEIKSLISDFKNLDHSSNGKRHAKVVRKKLSKFVDSLGNDFEKLFSRVSKRVSQFREAMLTKVSSSTSQAEHFGGSCKVDDVASTTSHHFSKNEQTTDTAKKCIPQNCDSGKNKVRSKRSIGKEICIDNVNFDNEPKAHSRKSKRSIKNARLRMGDFAPIPQDRLRFLSGRTVIDMTKKPSRQSDRHRTPEAYGRKHTPTRKASLVEEALCMGLRYEEPKIIEPMKNASSSIEGGWYSDIGESRERKRSVSTKSDWLFDRYRGRDKLRDGDNWSSNRASIRNSCRQKPKYPGCSTSNIL